MYQITKKTRLTTQMSCCPSAAAEMYPCKRQQVVRVHGSSVIWWLLMIMFLSVTIPQRFNRNAVSECLTVVLQSAWRNPITIHKFLTFHDTERSKQ
jgi:hypothetical protein